MFNKSDTDNITQVSTITKSFIGTTTGVTQGPNTYYTANMFVAKYNSSGTPLWVAQMGSNTNAGNNVYDIACDGSDNVYAFVGNSGSSVSPATTTFYNSDGTIYGRVSNIFGFGNFTAARAYLIKYNSAGQIQWINTVTAGDTNNQFVLLVGGSLTIDNTGAPYISFQTLRAGGGNGATSIKFYKYSSVDVGGTIQHDLITSDSYAFGGNPAEYHRGFLVKLDSSGSYSWVARMVMPTAYGENNGGTVNTNLVVDSANNVYLCLKANTSASSPICNIYSGTSALTNPLPATSSGYYRIDLRGNSISPSLPQYYKFAAIAKFNSSGVFQSLCSAHQLINSGIILDMIPAVGIHKASDTLYLTVNAQGYTGTNATTGAELNKLYINSFSANNTNGSNYDITQTNTFNVTLGQPQIIMAIIKYDSSLQAQAVAYIDTPSGNSGSYTSSDSDGNIYVATTINDTTTKTIFTFSELSGAEAICSTYSSVSADTSTMDGLIVSYAGSLSSARWATLVKSSDNLNDSGLMTTVDASNYLYVGGTSTLNALSGSNTINIYDYASNVNNTLETTLFGAMDVTSATDRAGFLIKYE